MKEPKTKLQVPLKEILEQIPAEVRKERLAKLLSKKSLDFRRGFDFGVQYALGAIETGVDEAKLAELAARVPGTPN